MSEFLNKNCLKRFLYGLKNSQARQGKAFRHLWQMKKFGKICLLLGSVQPISLRTLGNSEFRTKALLLVNSFYFLVIGFKSL